MLDLQTLTHIPFPKGVPPKNEGQIYKALTQIRAIKCKAHLKELESAKIAKENSDASAAPATQKVADISRGPVQSKVVFSSAPVKRDIEKELVQMVPASLRKKAE